MLQGSCAAWPMPRAGGFRGSRGVPPPPWWVPLAAAAAAACVSNCARAMLLKELAVLELLAGYALS